MRFWLLIFALIVFVTIIILVLAGAVWANNFKHLLALFALAGVFLTAAKLAGTPRPF